MSLNDASEHTIFIFTGDVPWPGFGMTLAIPAPAPQRFSEHANWLIPGRLMLGSLDVKFCYRFFEVGRDTFNV